MRTGTTVSVLAHGAVLTWAVLSVGSHPFDARQIESIPVALVSVADVTSLPKADAPAPVEAKPAPVPLPKPAPVRTPPAVADATLTPPPMPVAPKPAPEAPPTVASVAPPVPSPPPAPAAPKPAPEAPPTAASVPPPVPSPPPVPAASKPAPEAPPPVASAPQPVPSPAPVPVAPKPAPESPTTVASVPPPAPKARAAPPPKPATTADRPFLFDRIGALLSQSPPPAQSSPQKPAPARPSPPPASPAKPQSDALALGSLIASATADAHLTVSEVDALRTRIAQCWTPPSGWTDPAEVRVVMIINLSPDGSVAQTPQVVEAPVGRYANTAPESAVRAVRACAPYVLPPEKYPDWKEVKITFDPRAMGA